MSCTSYVDDNPVKEKAREDILAEKNLKAAKKIADFLQAKLNGACVAYTRGGTTYYEAKRLNLTVRGRNLTVHHRGYTISANCDDPSALSADFRNWLAVDMTHVTKIEPRTH